MKITIEPTEEFTFVGGQRCRVWKGKTEAGVDLEAFVTLILVYKDDDNSEFQHTLNKVQVDATDPLDYRVID